MNNVAMLLQQRQNKFIETRTIIESEVNKFLKSLEAQDAEVKAALKITDGLTARDWLPSLWEDDFDFEKYQQERSRFDQYVIFIANYAENVNREALACLQS